MLASEGEKTQNQPVRTYNGLPSSAHGHKQLTRIHSPLTLLCRPTGTTKHGHTAAWFQSNANVAAGM